MPTDRNAPQSPRLSPEQERIQRGEDPRTSWNKAPSISPSVDRERDAEKLDRAREVMEKLWRGRPHARVPLAPRLLIRAHPGDHGVRVPDGPMPFWESPDVHVVPALGSTPPTYDPGTHTYAGQTPTLRPTVGRRHWVFVHVWNLGPLAAFGVTVSAWWANPQFAFDLHAADPAQRPHLIGARHRLELPDRENPACHHRICVGSWTPVEENHGHECLLAKVTCMADGSAPTSLDAHHDRHVGQRNLHVVEPDEDLTPLLGKLDEALPRGADLELLHGLHDLEPLLLAHHRALANELRHPVALDPKTAFRAGNFMAHLGAMKFMSPKVHQPIPASVIGAHFAHKPAARALHPKALAHPAVLSHPEVRAVPTVRAPAAGLVRRLGVKDLMARTLTERLNRHANVSTGVGHVLRFRASHDGKPIGGYTVIVHS